MIFLAPHGPFYQFSDHGWNKPRGMAKREALFALSRLPQLLLRVLLAAVPTSDSAYTSCHAGLLQALIGTGFMCLVCACKMQQPGPCRSSGAIAKGAAVWFTARRKKWLLYWIMLCGSPGGKHPGASQPKWQGWQSWLERARRYDFN